MTKMIDSMEQYTPEFAKYVNTRLARLCQTEHALTKKMRNGTFMVTDEPVLWNLNTQIENLTGDLNDLYEQAQDHDGIWELYDSVGVIHHNVRILFNKFVQYKHVAN